MVVATNEIAKEDVESVAFSLNVELSADQVNEILSHYPSYADQFESEKWTFIVEMIIDNEIEFQH